MSDRSQADLIGEFGLVDRYRIDHLGQEMWTRALKWPSTKAVSYLVTASLIGCSSHLNETEFVKIRFLVSFVLFFLQPM